MERLPGQGEQVESGFQRNAGSSRVPGPWHGRSALSACVQSVCPFADSANPNRALTTHKASEEDKSTDVPVEGGQKGDEIGTCDSLILKDEFQIPADRTPATLCRSPVPAVAGGPSSGCRASGFLLNIFKVYEQVKE